MNILVATSDYPPDFGGMAVYSAAWVRELRALGHSVRVLVRRAAGCKFPPREAGEADETETLQTATWQSGLLRDPWHAYHALNRALTTRHSDNGAAHSGAADIVFAHTWIGWGPALAILKGRTGQKYVLAAHGAEILGPARSPWYRPLLDIALKGANRVVPVSEFTADAIAARGVSRERIHVIGNGVDTSLYHPSSKNQDLIKHHGLEGRDVIITIGGLVDRKGQDIAIRAMALLKNTHPNLRYLVVGGWTLSGSRETDLKQLVVDCGVAERIVFTGFVAPELLPDYYRLGDLFVLPGREVIEKGWVEGFGISLLEAAACGVPLVTTLTGGVADAIDAGHAIVIPPENPVETARAIAALLDDPERRARMSASGAAWAGQRTWTARVANGASLFDELLKRT